MTQCNEEILSLKWNRCDSKLEPPETVVWVFTSDLVIRKGLRKGYSKSYNGYDYIDAESGEKLGKALYWAYI